jgi:hypothetical protein
MALAKLNFAKYRRNFVSLQTRKILSLGNNSRGLFFQGDSQTKHELHQLVFLFLNRHYFAFTARFSFYYYLNYATIIRLILKKQDFKKDASQKVFMQATRGKTQQ